MLLDWGMGCGETSLERGILGRGRGGGGGRQGLEGDKVEGGYRGGDYKFFVVGDR